MEKVFWQASVRFLLVTFAIISLIFAVYYVFPLVYPFLIGILFAFVFNPFVALLKRKAKFPRWLSVTLAILLLLALIVTIVILVVLEIISEINSLQETLPVYVENYVIQIQQFIMQDLALFYDQFSTYYMSLDPEIRQNVQSQFQSFSNQLVELGQDAIKGLFNGILAFIGSVPTMATAFIISLLASFFISKDWPRLQRKFVDVVPERLQRSGWAVLSDLKKALFGFIKAQLTLISITFVIVLIGFSVIGIEYALTLALITALADLLPYVGTGLIFVPWLIYLFIDGNYTLVIGLSILFGVVLVQRQMMEPKILGTNVGLDPLLTLVALFVGFKLFGLIGLLIGPVSMIIIGALYRANVLRDLWKFIKVGA